MTKRDFSLYLKDRKFVLPVLKLKIEKILIDFEDGYESR